MLAVAGEKNESGIVRYIRESVSEMRKVVWPTQQETIRLTGVVIGISVVIGLLLGAADFMFTTLIQFMGG
ncbi:MAG: hypothetical protein KatS3mg057_1966 [Herpetosiphonaceae bacterium]|nr:MAG: hypothetical protein KatS3mg057_1966 [Herpetosiphonaceae bacterium]